MSQSREKLLVTNPTTLVMVLNPNQKRFSLPLSSLLARLLLMRPTLPLSPKPRLLLKLLLMPPLPKVLAQVLLDSLLTNLLVVIFSFQVT